VKLSAAGTETEHGVLQPGPREVTALAPGAPIQVDVHRRGVGLKASMENDENRPDRDLPRQSR